MTTTVTPLYDQELEALTWDENEAKCEGFWWEWNGELVLDHRDCPNSARWLRIKACGCRLLACDQAKALCEQFCRAYWGNIECGDCGVIIPKIIRYEAI